MTYVAPLVEQRFVLETIADIADLAHMPAYAAATPDTVDAVLTQASTFSAEVFAPLNKRGDREGARWDQGRVTLPDGFRDAYQHYVASGWNTLAGDANFGGQGLPFVLAAAVMEQLQSANMALSLSPMLTMAAIEALQAHGDVGQKELYLRKLMTGEWTGTMNLTEPQAGSDVGALRTKAVRQEDGTYRIKGSKIFITWGEHDCADNIIHLVLARTPDGPPGTKGISLFIVPKFFVTPDGTCGAPNDVRCVSIEHKLGIHASPTCTMSFGDQDQCVGYLVGKENEGMRAMFTMMNHARINVGLQGVAIAERAYQAAVHYARNRVQSAPFGGGRAAVRIIEHADVRRMLMTMKATTEAIRALTYANAAAVDRAHGASTPDQRQAAQGRADLLTPITKAYATDMGVELTSIAIQVCGGMGFIEETGVAQYFRDARIAPIYEGTNGIQALDLVGRKIPAQDGAHWKALFAEIHLVLKALAQEAAVAPLAAPLTQGLEALQTATLWIMAHQGTPPVAAAATPYLRMFGMMMGGYVLAKQALVAAQALRHKEDPFLSAKIITARFFAENTAPHIVALLAPVMHGADTLYALPEAQFFNA